MAKDVMAPAGAQSLTLGEASHHNVRTFKGSPVGETLRPPVDGHGGTSVETAPPAPAKPLDETTAPAEVPSGPLHPHKHSESWHHLAKLILVS